MLLGGQWVSRKSVIEVKDPHNQDIIATVPSASKQDMLNAIEKAKEGFEISKNLAVHERMTILNRAANLVEKRQDKLALLIAREGSKVIREARKEVERCVHTLRISAEEARRLQGETIPFDQMPGADHRVGHYYRFPIGIIGAITPFNDPLNLVAHKIGPAIASGNAIIVKPASFTPLSALALAEIMLEAGLPPKILTVITGSGSTICDELISHPDVRMISFTGGLETGTEISHKAGLKKLSMELGSNAPTLVMADADIDLAVGSTVSGAFWAAGQNCIGVQRIFVHESIINAFTLQFVARTRSYRIGDKLDEKSDMGPLITEQESQRVEVWVNEALEKGATLLCGGRRKGAYFEPTVLTDVPHDCRLAQEEIFGPVVVLVPFHDISAAIRQANNVNYGLQAGIFTSNIELAYKAIHQLDVGGVMINDSSDFRIDAMPFGGVKGSGLGREGVKSSIQEMTEPKVVCFNLQG